MAVDSELKTVCCGFINVKPVIFEFSSAGGE
jgi:hypothetical protein